MKRRTLEDIDRALAKAGVKVPPKESPPTALPQTAPRVVPFPRTEKSELKSAKASTC